MPLGRGVPQVPFDPDMSPQVRRFLVDMRESVVQLRGAQAPPSVPTNLKVTPQAFANLVQWTRPLNYDYLEVLWSPSPDISQSTAVNVGDSAQWTDNVGQSGITRYYWVRSHKFSGARSIETGPASGTTLASGTGVTPPTPPPAGQRITTDPTTGRLEQPPLDVPAL